MAGFSERTECLADMGGSKWSLYFAAKAKIDAGEDVISLSIGEPELPPPDLMKETVKASLEAGRVGYTIGAGNLDLREVLAERYTQRTGRDISAYQIIVTAGTQNGLFLALQTLAGPGDEVILTDPLYVTYEGVVRASGATPVFVPLRPEMNFHLQADDVARVISSKTKLILLNSPHNPTGAVLDEQHLKAIGKLAKENDLWILSDEVYEELVFDNVSFVSSFDQGDLADRTVVLSSVSKSHAAPGYRVGWLVASEVFCNAALPITETELFGISPFTQDAVKAVLEQGPSSIAASMRANYARRAQMIFNRLDGIGGLKTVLPQAGMFALLDVRGRGETGAEFGTHLLESTGVAVMPGSSFGQELKGFVRISLTVEDEVLSQGLDRISAGL